MVTVGCCFPETGSLLPREAPNRPQPAVNKARSEVISIWNLFPLNGCRWFGTDVIDYAVDPFYVIDYIGGDLCE